MSTNHCLHHEDRDANFVCAVCGKYFCEECVGERYYPEPGYICHHCSGVKPSEATPPPQPQPKAEPEEEEADRGDARPWMGPPLEWAVVVVCAVLIAVRAFFLLSPQEEVIELASEAPEDVAEYCISKLSLMERRGDSADRAAIVSACPEPLAVQRTDYGFLVLASDPDTFGFTEIEVETRPVRLMIME